MEGKIYTYEHQAKYYETDQMGIIHHSNYIRWMEEARMEFMKDTGFSYAAMEKMGIISPVTHVDCDYKSMTGFDETVVIGIKVTRYNGVRLCFEYEICDKETGKVRALANSAHCFLNREGRPVSLKRSCPQADRLFEKALTKM